MLIKLQNKYPTNYHFRANSSWNVVEARRSEKPSKAAKRWLGKLYESSSNFSPLHFQYFTHLKLNSARKKETSLRNREQQNLVSRPLTIFQNPIFVERFWPKVMKFRAHTSLSPDGRWVRLMTEASLVRAVRNWNRSKTHKSNNNSSGNEVEKKKKWASWKGQLDETKKMFLIFFCFSHFFNDDA